MTKQTIPSHLLKYFRPRSVIKPKNDLLIPHRFAIAMQEAGWILRSAISLVKQNPMPESVTDRPTSATEMLFLLAKQPKYYYDAAAIAEATECGRMRGPALHGDLVSTNGNDGLSRRPIAATRNRRNWWKWVSSGTAIPHFAVMPESIVEPCILAGSSPHACAACGAPWQRVVEKERLRAAAPSGAREIGRWTTRDSASVGNRMRVIGATWQSTCECPDNDGSGQCVVLDPFGGSGTTSVVAIRHGRRAISVDLNPAYIEMSRRRIEASLHADNVLDRPRIPMIDGQTALFPEFTGGGASQ